MPGKETSFNISLPTFLFLIASLVSGAISFGTMFSSISEMKTRVTSHDEKIDTINAKLNYLIGNSEAMKNQVQHLNEGIDRIK